jgi:hypothetical protein
MEDEKRLSALLDLSKQHMQRCRELEEIEWRVNFSVWAFLGGLAYLWASGHIVSPGWMRWPPTMLLFPLSVTFMHGFANLWFWSRSKSEAKLRDGYRRDIAKLLGVDKDYPDRGLTLRDLVWMAWQWLVTLAIAAAVMLVVQNAVVQNATISK